MKCILCENFSFLHICTSCQKLFLTPSLYRTTLSNGVEVLSFYRYEDIKNLLHTKHTDIGYYIYTILAANSFKYFAENLDLSFNVVSIGIDDNPKGKYSHTAILNKSLKTKYITPLYSRLRATNNVSYSGKNRAFRLANPRVFQLKKFEEDKVIIVDDIMTTGSTLLEATQLLQQNNKEILFCLVLTNIST